MPAAPEHPSAPGRRPKVLLAPQNFAAMPVTLAAALRARGYDAAHLQYAPGRQNRLDYPADRIVDPGAERSRIRIQMRTLAETLDEGFDIFHFWNRSLVFRSDFGGFSGIDLPIIRARGRRIVHRFTGYDLRLPSLDLAVNPHSPFRYEQRGLYDEDLVKAYHDHLRQYVDHFFVQDPEMAQFWPDAEIVPRALDLADWGYVGAGRPTRPLVVHAPTNAAAKGTRFVLAAVERLKAEGLAFDFQLLGRMPHAEARAVYRRADVVVDQLLIGATGVLTLEAWALGKTVVTNLRPDLFGPFYGTAALPVVQADPDTITDALRQAITDADLRQELAPRGRALVEAHHDIAKVVDAYIAAYERLHAAPPVRPTGDGDIRFLALQMEQAERAEGFWREWVNSYRRTYRRERALMPGRALAGTGSWRARLRQYVAAFRPLVERDIRFLKDLKKKLF